ncbi:MAG: hypothetical protein JXA10_13585 [Anaerolineae bacterium]|nr:hypothetical protein [Anaerolineae bacterium]
MGKREDSHYLVAVGITVAAWLFVSACTLIGESDAGDSGVRDQLAAKLTETQQAQTAALALWDRVIFGEMVSCADYFSVPPMVILSDHDRSAHPNAAAIQTQLNAAIQAIHNSADLWNIECADTRPYVPLSMAKEGRITALAASEALAEAERLLAAW